MSKQSKGPVVILFVLLLLFAVSAGFGSRRDSSEERQGSDSQLDPKNLKLPGWISGLSETAIGLFGAGDVLDETRIQWANGVVRNESKGTLRVSGPLGERQIAQFLAKPDADFASAQLVCTTALRVGFKDGDQDLDWTQCEANQPLRLMVSERGGVLWIKKQNEQPLELKFE